MILACEDANSNFAEVVTVADFDHMQPFLKVGERESDQLQTSYSYDLK